MNKGVIGERHGPLVLLALCEEKTRDHRITAIWQCDCGERKTLSIGRVRSGQIKSCGDPVHAPKPNLKHGMRGTKEYRAWKGAKERCCKETAKDYGRYGGAGITFHDAWRDDFQAFYDHIGPCPSPDHQIDRIDTLRGYEPGNVRWAGRKVQMRNRRTACEWFIKGGKFGSAQDAANHFSVSVQTIWRWVRGQEDKRRGTFTEKREDCYAIARY